MSDKLYLTTLIKAFDVLDCFQSDCQELGITDIASTIGIPISTTHRFIRSLEYEGMLLQNPETKRYSLGPKVMGISKKCQQYQDFLKAAIPFVDQLGKETGETVNLSSCSCDRIVHLYHAESRFVLRPNFSLNAPFPAYNTSVGRVFLSYMSDDTLAYIYDNHAKEITCGKEAFIQMLHDVRRQGYAQDDQDFDAGLRCVGAPICLFGGKPLFAISISAPISRMDDARYEAARQLVISYAARISSEIQALERFS